MRMMAESRTFLWVVYDLVLLAGGGVIGAVVGIYYSRMIPVPREDFLSLRLLLSLIVVMAIFLPILYAIRREVDRKDVRAESPARDENPSRIRPEDEALILSKINTRESSTLTFSTVAASASLVVMGLAVGRNSPWWLPWIGVFFALLGFLYREITLQSTDRTDYKLLPKLYRSVRERKGFAFLRRSIVRLFLLLPIVAWVALEWNLDFVLGVIIASVFSLAISTADHYTD
jgi:hypothetical protein